MSGFCSAHRHHDPGCTVCAATPPNVRIAEIEADEAAEQSRLRASAEAAYESERSVLDFIL